MTPREITQKLMALRCVFQAVPKNMPNGMNGLMAMLGGHGGEGSPASEDYSQIGNNVPDSNESDESAADDLMDRYTPHGVIVDGTMYREIETLRRAV